MAHLQRPVSAVAGLPLRTARRRFLQRSTALFIGAVLSSCPVGFALSDADDARADAQWARLKRGLSPKAMAGCRKAAERLAPRLGELLKGPQWESQLYRAVAAELKQAGVYPDRPPLAGPGCTEADALRGEAESTKSGDASVRAALDVAAAAVATMPGLGTVIAAVVAVIAAVIVLIGQIIAKALEDQAAAKEGKDAKEQVAKLKKARSRAVTETEARDDCTLFAKKPD